MEFKLYDKEYVDGNQLMARKGDPNIDQGSKEEEECKENIEVTWFANETQKK